MTKEKLRLILQATRSFLVTFICFFVLITFVVSCSFLLFFNNIQLLDEQVRAAAPYTFFNIIFLTFVFVLIETIRGKIMIDRPIRRIKEGLKKITKGDFNTKIKSEMTDDKNRFEEIINSINQMAQELSGVETLRTDFIANVSHELKTPLAVIQNYCTMLQKSDLSEENRMEYAKAITDATRRLTSLVTNILKLNRLENQQIFPLKREYNLGEQICECLLTFESEWEKKRINIKNDIDEDIIIDADEELLCLVWNNLFSNAIKFNMEAGDITVSAKKFNEFVIVKIADSGCGISKETGQHIFEKFYQGETSHTVQGNGLGLALVKRVIDIMNGDISVESLVGEGSTFAVKLRRVVNEQN